MSANGTMTSARQLHLNSLITWLNMLYFTWGNNTLVIFNMGCGLQKQKCLVLREVSDCPMLSNRTRDFERCAHAGTHTHPL